MKIDGACHCGYVKFEGEANPERVTICHCTDCQTMAGSAFRVIVQIPSDKFVLLENTPKVYVKTSESGNPREQAFCPECGTHLWACDPGDGPKMYGIRLGSVRQREQLPPKKQIWVRSSQKWLDDLADIPKVDQQVEFRN